MILSVNFTWKKLIFWIYTAGTFEERRWKIYILIFNFYVYTKIVASIVNFVTDDEAAVVAIQNLSPNVAGMIVFGLSFDLYRNDIVAGRCC